MDRSKQIIRTSVIGIIANVLLAGFKALVGLLASPINQLLGASVSADLTHEIKSEILEMEGVQGVYDIIVHGYGPNLSIGSLHISVPDTMDAREIHGLTRKISELMMIRHGIVMTVGIYANATGNNPYAQLQKTVTQTLSQSRYTPFTTMSLITAYRLMSFLT